MEQSYFNYNLKPGLAIDDFLSVLQIKKHIALYLIKKLIIKKFY